MDHGRTLEAALGSQETARLGMGQDHSRAYMEQTVIQRGWLRDSPVVRRELAVVVT